MPENLLYNRLAQSLRELSATLDHYSKLTGNASLLLKEEVYDELPDVLLMLDLLQELTRKQLEFLRNRWYALAATRDKAAEDKQTQPDPGDRQITFRELP
jgi:hypothetical protein